MAFWKKKNKQEVADTYHAPAAYEIPKVYIENPVSIETRIPAGSFVGRYTCINPNTVYGPAEFGRYCSVAATTHIGACNHPLQNLTTHPISYVSGHMFDGNADYLYIREKNKTNPVVTEIREGNFYEEGYCCKIKNDVWVGTGAVILSNITIGDGAVIAANAVVTKDVPPYAVVGGVPAKVLKYRFEQHIVDELLKLKWWNLPLGLIKDFDFTDVEKCVSDLKSIRKIYDKKVYLLNDTTRDANHLGCTTVIDNILELTEKHGMDILYRDVSCPNSDFDKDAFIAQIKECDMLLFNGEGTLHRNRGKSHLEKCKIAKEFGKLVVLTNASWFFNTETDDYLDYFDLVSVRESLSKAEIEKTGKCKDNLFQVPDLSFYSYLPRNAYTAQENGVAVIDDILPDHAHALLQVSKNKNYRYYFMGDYTRDNLDTDGYENCATLGTVDEIKKLSHLVSGRYHGSCLSVMSGVPVLSITSNTDKTKGMLMDAGIDISRYYIEDVADINDDRVAEFVQQDHSEFISKALKYSYDAKGRIEDFWEKIFLLRA